MCARGDCIYFGVWSCGWQRSESRAKLRSKCNAGGLKLLSLRDKRRLKGVITLRDTCGLKGVITLRDTCGLKGMITLRDKRRLKGVITLRTSVG